MTLTDLRAVHPHVSDSSIIESSISGRADTFVASGCTFDLVDLSRLHLRDSDLAGEYRRTVRFPDFPDSFVVRRATLAAIEPELQKGLGPPAMAFYQRFRQVLIGPFVPIDDRLFVVSKGDDPDAISEAEKQRCISSSPPPPSGGDERPDA